MPYYDRNTYNPALPTAMGGLLEGIQAGQAIVGNYEDRKRQKMLDQQRQEQQQFNNDLALKQEQRAEDQASQQGQLNSLQIDQAKRKLTMEQVKNDLAHVNDAMTLGEKPKPETLARLKDNGIDLEKFMDPTYKAAADRIGDTMSKIAAGDMRIAQVNSPEFLRDYNKLFAKRINVGPIDLPDGYKITNKKVIGFVPSPQHQDRVGIHLQVTAKNDKGKTKTYEAPVTEGRATSDEALVKMVPVRQLVTNFKSMHDMIQSANTPEFKTRFQQIMANHGITTPKAEAPKPVVIQEGRKKVTYMPQPDGTLKRVASGSMDAPEKSPSKYFTGKDGNEYVVSGGTARPVMTQGMPEDQRRQAAAERAGQPLPSKAAAAEYDKLGPQPFQAQNTEKQPAALETIKGLVRMGIAPDEKSAWRIYKQSTDNPQKFIRDYVMNQQQAQTQAYVKPGSPEYKDKDQLVQEAQSIVEASKKGVAPDTGAEQAQKDPQAMKQDFDGAQWALQQGVPVEKVIDQLRKLGYSDQQIMDAGIGR